MKLTAAERVNLLNILVDMQGNFLTLKIVNDLKMSLSFTEKEHKDFYIKVVGDKVSWNEKGHNEVEIAIGEKATDIIVEKLLELDKSKKLTMAHYSIYQKFIGVKA